MGTAKSRTPAVLEILIPQKSGLFSNPNAVLSITQGTGCAHHFFAIVVVIWLNSLKNVLHECGMNDNIAILHI